MRKLFALILILGVLACALGFYAADTFETSDYYRVLNPVSAPPWVTTLTLTR